MNSNYAYVTFLIRNDSYLPGTMLLAHELKKRTEYDTVCLVTETVSDAAIKALELVYDRVVQIQEFILKSCLTDGRSDRSSLLTRFSALRTGPDGDLGLGYQKILLLDSDVLPIYSLDSLFDLPAPAGILMEKKEFCLSYDADGKLIRSVNEKEEWCWHEHYRIVPHGHRVCREITDRVLKDCGNMGVNSALWRLDPSMEEYDEVLNRLRDPEMVRTVTRCFPWPEMQLATVLWSGRWTNIDVRYCSIGGYPDLQLLYSTHFAGLKPWQLHSRSLEHYRFYPDFQLWYACYLSLMQTYPQLLRLPMLKRIYDYIRLK